MFKIKQRKKMCVPHSTPIFRPEMMFSYFNPKLQLLGNSAMGLLGSTTKNWHFLVGYIKIGFNFLGGLWNKDLHELFYAYCYL